MKRDNNDMMEAFAAAVPPFFQVEMKWFDYTLTTLDFQTPKSLILSHC